MRAVRTIKGKLRSIRAIISTLREITGVYNLQIIHASVLDDDGACCNRKNAVGHEGV